MSPQRGFSPFITPLAGRIKPLAGRGPTALWVFLGPMLTIYANQSLYVYQTIWLCFHMNVCLKTPIDHICVSELHGKKAQPASGSQPAFFYIPPTTLCFVFGVSARRGNSPPPSSAHPAATLIVGSLRDTPTVPSPPHSALFSLAFHGIC